MNLFLEHVFFSFFFYVAAKWLCNAVREYILGLWDAISNNCDAGTKNPQKGPKLFFVLVYRLLEY